MIVSLTRSPSHRPIGDCNDSTRQLSRLPIAARVRAIDDVSAVIPRLSDAAYQIVTTIVEVVPASHWTFARIDAHGHFSDLLTSDGASVVDISKLTSEVTHQRMQVPTGPRIAATLTPLGIFASGITLLFANARTTLGVLTLLRTAALGPFSSAEIRMLTLALSATSEQLSAMHLYSEDHRRASSGVRNPAGPIAEHSSPTDSASYILDRELAIVLAWNHGSQGSSASEICTQVSDRLPAVLEQSVRELVAGWNHCEPTERDAVVARPVPFLAVYAQPMSGPTGLFIGVQIKGVRPKYSLCSAAAHFHISPRELQVLALLFDGEQLDEIGRRLFITSSTVQDHIRHMVEKTASRNRTELVARVLTWEAASDRP